MSLDLDPIVLNWYRHLDKGQEFRVVAVDEDAATVDLQYFDGTLDTVDLDAWYELDIEAIEPPESWEGALDVAEADDLAGGIADTAPDDWRAPGEELRHPDEREPLIGNEEADDWQEGRMHEEPWEGER